MKTTLPPDPLPTIAQPAPPTAAIPVQAAWQTPPRMPPGATTVLVRTDSKTVPVFVAYHNSGKWHNLNATPLASNVTGWLRLKDAAWILDNFGPPVSK